MLCKLSRKKKEKTSDQSAVRTSGYRKNIFFLPTFKAGIISWTYLEVYIHEKDLFLDLQTWHAA